MYGKGFNLYSAAIAEKVRNGINKLMEEGKRHSDDRVKMIVKIRKIIKGLKTQTATIISKNEEAKEWFNIPEPIHWFFDNAEHNTIIKTITENDRGLLVSFLAHEKHGSLELLKFRKPYFENIGGKDNYQWMVETSKFLRNKVDDAHDFGFNILPDFSYRRKVEEMESKLKDLALLYSESKIVTLEVTHELYKIEDKLSYLYRRVSNRSGCWNEWSYLERTDMNNYINTVERIKELALKFL